MKTANSILVTLALSLMIGCTTLTPQQSTEYDRMKTNGVLIAEKDPVFGALLGILPGGGAFYGRQPVVGVADLLMWPVSILWDPIVGYQQAKTVNYNSTVNALRKAKQQEINELHYQKELEQVSKAEYVKQRKDIEQKYNYDS